MHDGVNRIYGLHVIITITDVLQNAKSLTIFQDFVVRGQGQELVNWSSGILENKDNKTGLNLLLFAQLLQVAQITPRETVP